MRKTILLIGGQKGGGGKTTTAVTLAVLRKQQGRDVLLIDGDPQKSATTWAMRRSDLDDSMPRVPCVALYGRTLAREVQGLAAKYDDIVIDVAGHKSEEFLSAMTVAHRLLTPVQASQFDLDTMVEVNDLVGMMKTINPDLDATWFVNRAPTNPSSKDAALAGARQSLEDLHNLRPLKSHLCNRTAFELTGTGIIITETPASVSQEKGVFEMNKLHDEVWKW